jgi:hypothetical protein
MSGTVREEVALTMPVNDEGHCLLRDGTPTTGENYQQWLYEFFDRISNDLGQDNTPCEVFPAIVRVMVEWVEAVRDLDDDLDRRMARTLADAVSALSGSLQKCLMPVERDQA